MSSGQLQGLGALGRDLSRISAERQAAAGDPRRLQLLLAQEEQQRLRQEEEEQKRLQEEIFKDPKYRNIATILGPQFAFQQRESDIAESEQKAQEEEQKKLREEYIKQYPEMAEIFSAFEAGIPAPVIKYQQDLSQAKTESEAFNKTLDEAGFSNQEKSLIFAGMKPKDVIELREDEKSFEQKTIAQIQKESIPDPMTIGGLENINEAFGAGDVAEQFINQTLGPITGTVFPETSKAVSARNVLNEKIREKFVNQYSGRPSVYLNQRIDALLPQSSYASGEEAANKYKEIKRVMIEGAKEIEAKYNSGLYEGTELLEVQNNLSSIYSIINDIDIALSALPQTEVTLKAREQSNAQTERGRFDSLYTGD